MSKKKVTEEEIAALTQDKQIGTGNLIERTRTAAFLNAPSSLSPLLNELAGEVERLWRVEEDHQELVTDFREARLRWADKIATMEAEHAAEIDSIKSTVNAAAISNGYYRGYVTAAGHLTPIINTLLSKVSHNGEG